MKRLAFFFAILLGLFGARAVDAATLTVCGSGCDYASVSDAVVLAGTGDTIQVNGGGASPYNSASETFNIAFVAASTTLQCINGATIAQASPTGGNTILLTTSSTVTGCGFSNIELRIAPSSVVSGVIISGNTFSSSATGTISFAGDARNFSILNNTNVGLIHISSTSTDGLIEGNTVYGRNTLGSDQAGYFASSVSSSRLTVRNNVFNSYVTTTSDSTVTAVVMKGEDVTFVSNTIRMVNTPPSAFIGSIGIHASGTVTVSGNKIDSPIRGSGTCTIVSVAPPADVPWNLALAFENNTLRGRCSDGGGLNVSDGSYFSPISISATIRRNAIYGAGSSGAALRFVRGLGTAFTIANTDNGVYGYAATLVNAGSSNVTQGTGYKSTDPFLRTDDADTTNDIEIAPFSDYLDYSGTADIGATTGSRRTTIYVDDTGTVDYSSVDATALTFVTSTLRSGDTLSIAGGTYGPFFVSSTLATTTLTILGSGSDTIINGSTGNNALRLTNVTSSAVSGLVLQNASTTSNGYTGTRMGFFYGGNGYDQASAEAEVSASSTLLVSAGCSISSYNEDGASFSAFIGDATSDINIGLVDMGDGRVTALIPNDVASSGSAFSTLCGGLTVDRFVTSAFTVSGGVYTYQAGTVAAAGLTLSNGVTTPAISRVSNGYAGLKLEGSGGITVTNVTSTANGYGVWFASGGGNSLVDSVLSSSVLYDAYQAATAATNTLDNVTFTRVSSTVDTLAKPLLIKYRVRARINRATAPGTFISTSAVTIEDGLDQATSLGSSDVDGYTSYARVPAYTVTNASNALTNGGYNPYSFVAGGVTGYNASTTAETISSRDQTVVIGLTSSATAAPPTGTTVGSITASTAVVTWTDVATTEDAYVFDYTTSTLGLAFPGTVSILAEDAATASITGLFPNLGYQVRVAARNATGDSAYALSSEFRTLAVAPGSPSLTALSGTTASVVMDANGNSTSTEFVLFNSTSGQYVGATGALSSSQAWQTTSTWASVTISGLTCGTTYSFLAVARNASSVETVSSTAATVSTNACASSGGGGGGGGGAVGSGSSIGIPVFVPSAPLPTVPATTPTILPPIEVTFLNEIRPSAGPVLEPGVSPSTLPPASAVSLRMIEEDARSFQVTLVPTDRERLAAFIDAGTTAETRALGSGERRALLRDALQTIGRSSIPTSDLERLARGQIPATRNLEIERTQVPRARTTFRTIYGHDPDFRNPEENLTWNTLMYRIRFPRDLALERQGIQEFRTLFRRDPQDPFQWAVVRALGYVER